MDNEEKMLSLLELMNNRLDSMDNRLDSMDNRLDSMDNRLDSMQSDMQVLTSDVQALKSDVQDLQIKVLDLDGKVDKVHYSQITVELEWFPKISLALEGVTGGTDKNREQDKRIEILENRSEDHGIRIFALESTVKNQ